MEGENDKPFVEAQELREFRECCRVLVMSEEEMDEEKMIMSSAKSLRLEVCERVLIREVMAILNNVGLSTEP